ncbi:844_t:CDS:2 [Racocetra persica]|uniref:844_t:CDS:1 n=1 Tax=Racocetra persica TaxID=160502 RepID=A0ACA9KP88_9GLOM|nr:844_t:CDS:2 [Racocetra persica]
MLLYFVLLSSFDYLLFIHLVPIEVINITAVKYIVDISQQTKEV